MDEQLKYFYPLHLISSDVPPLTQSVYSIWTPLDIQSIGLTSPPDTIYSNSTPLNIQWYVIGPPDIQLKVHSNPPPPPTQSNPHHDAQSFHKT